MAEVDKLSIGAAGSTVDASQPVGTDTATEASYITGIKLDVDGGVLSV